MFKLIKYEFRKNRTGMLVMLAVALALLALAPLGRLLQREGMMVASTILLAFYTLAAYVFVLVRGVSAYSGELRGRTGYLLMMVPRSALSVLFSKLIFTLAFALVMMGASALATAAAGGVMLSEMYSARSIVDVLRIGLLQLGVRPEEALAALLALASSVLASIVSLVSIGYLSVTLSATVLQQGRLRLLLEAVIAVALLIAVTQLTNLVTPDGGGVYASNAEALLAAAPAILLNFGLSAAFTALSAHVLRRKLSL